MINTILFDLDGTLLPMDLEEFITYYFGSIKNKFDKLTNNGESVLHGVLAGTKAMMKNDGKNTNEVVFWNTFVKSTNINKADIETDFEDFYRNEFCGLKKICKQNKNMVEAVHCLKEKGYRLLLTTNPMFPKIAVEERLSWSGIDPKMFEYITSYESSHATKPNIAYYEEVMKTMQLKREQCMMVGNDSEEDGVIETLGIPLYLVTDHLIHRNDSPLMSKWNGSSNDFIKFVEELPEIV